MQTINIEQIAIIKTNAGTKQIEALKKLTGSDKIKKNGKILIVCDFTASYKTLKSEIAKIMNIKESEIYFKYSER